MPALVEGLQHWVCAGLAWRWALFVPGGLQALCGVVVLVASDDSPSGVLREAAPIAPPTIR